MRANPDGVVQFVDGRQRVQFGLVIVPSEIVVASHDPADLHLWPPGHDVIPDVINGMVSVQIDEIKDAILEPPGAVQAHHPKKRTPGILPNPLLNALPDGLHVLSVRPVQVNRIRLVPPWIDAGQSAAPCLEQDLRVGAPEGANLDALTGQPVARQELAELVPANQHLQICRVHRST